MAERSGITIERQRKRTGISFPLASEHRRPASKFDLPRITAFGSKPRGRGLILIKSADRVLAQYGFAKRLFFRKLLFNRDLPQQPSAEQLFGPASTVKDGVHNDSFPGGEVQYPVRLVDNLPVFLNTHF